MIVARRPDALSPRDRTGDPSDGSKPSDPSPSLAGLETLDASALRQRWQSLVGGSLPAGLGRDLIQRIIAYQQQVQRYGDLDRASRQVLAEMIAASKTSLGSEPIEGAPGKHQAAHAGKLRLSRVLRPGTLLTREYAGVLHRVIVMDAGFGWNGRTYDSLSKAAFAITGTHLPSHSKEANTNLDLVQRIALA